MKILNKKNGFTKIIGTVLFLSAVACFPFGANAQENPKNSMKKIITADAVYYNETQITPGLKTIIRIKNVPNKKVAHPLSAEAEKVLGQYGGYESVSASDNGTGISVEDVFIVNNSSSRYVISIGYSNKNLLKNKKDIEKITAQLSVVDINSPEQTLPFDVSVVENVRITPPAYKEVLESYSTVLSIDTPEPKIILVRFAGYEDKKVKTKPLFFIIELNGELSRVINENPYTDTK